MGGVPESLYQGLQISLPDLGPNLPGHLTRLGQTWPPMQIPKACKMGRYFPMQPFHHQRQSTHPHPSTQSEHSVLAIQAMRQLIPHP